MNSTVVHMIIRMRETPGLQRIAQSYLLLYFTEIIYRLTYAKRNQRMALALQVYKKASHKKPKQQIKREITLCKKYWGCYPMHYFRYELYQKEKKLSDQQLINYIPEFFFYFLYLPYYSKPRNRHILFDKQATENLFAKLKINQPVTLGIMRKNSSDVQVILKDIKQKKIKTFFVKPLKGRGGYGIFIFHRDDQGAYFSNEGEQFSNLFWKKNCVHDDYIIQEGIEQHSELSKIYPHSVNTFRIISKNENGKVQPICAILRMGRDLKELDNASQDGIFVNINIATGQCSDFAQSELFEKFSAHPDTNFSFKNYSIKKWKEIIEFVKQSAKKLPQFTYIGWDIALTKQGPIAIEANIFFALDVFQYHLGGLKDTFCITNPKFYWKHKGKRV